MNSPLMAGLLFAILAGVILAGRLIRARLPEAHLSSDSKDSVKVSLGLVATMTALLLGLLVSSAKGGFDQQRQGILQVSGKVMFLGRVLSAIGPDAAPARAHAHEFVQEMTGTFWSGTSSDVTEAKGRAAYEAILRLAPSDDLQRAAKAEAAKLMVEVGQLRMGLAVQAGSAVPLPLFGAVMLWLALIFLGFSTIAPANRTTTLFLLSAALSVAVAIYLVLELDQAFSGLIQISPEPMIRAAERFL
jgi:hypothetical protein